MGTSSRGALFTSIMTEVTESKSAALPLEVNIRTSSAVIPTTNAHPSVPKMGTEIPDNFRNASAANKEVTAASKNGAEVLYRSFARTGPSRPTNQKTSGVIMKGKIDE